MFELNGLEVFITTIWITGVVAALFLFGRDRTAQTILALLAAVFVPVIGSLVALALAVHSLRSKADDRRREWHA